ncbi:MAG: 23S rRNA (guanosine(2251)-2'-O)-methyltransferase RlmB [Candidatus Hydrogenedens sp.]|nr:23S rRNA (guanosine(2251)-2'-O)-methyltransferase RlmB [Candidatus Hydrogenedens sp.]
MAKPHDVVIGRIPVLECLRAGKRPARRLFYLASAQGLDELLHAARMVQSEPTDRQTLDRMTQGAMHQGVVLHADPLPVLDVKSWLSDLPRDGHVCAVMLDGIEDPQNFGSIIRSAAAFGASAVLFGKDRAAPLSPAAIKAAAGAAEYIDLVEAGNLARSLVLLKEAGFWCAGLEAEGAKDLWDADLKGRTLLIVGSEGKGMKRLLREACDFLVRIPIDGPITSLNAGVSAAIALAEWKRQTR